MKTTVQALLVSVFAAAALAVGRAGEKTSTSPLETLGRVTIVEFNVNGAPITNAVYLLNIQIKQANTNGVAPEVRVEIGPTHLVDLPENEELAEAARGLFKKAISSHRVVMAFGDLPAVSLHARNWPAVDILTALAREADLGWWVSGNDIVLRSNPGELVCGAWRADEALVQGTGLDQSEDAYEFFLIWPPRHDKDAVVWIHDQRILLMVQQRYVVEFFEKYFARLGGKMKPVAKAKDGAQREP